MFESLKAPAPDKIIELIGLFAADPRPDKLDLGIGVYKDAEGRTPVMRAVKDAERKLWEEQDTKAYLGVLGDREFVGAMRELVFGNALPAERIGGAQTPGGTGAVRQLCELVRRARPEAVAWISNPTWPNHPTILGHLGFETRNYRYYDPATGAVDFAAMQADLAEAKAGDLVVLHGCCHNPTGANLTAEQWAELTDDFATRGIIPLIDLAYQGFGDGLDSDVAGVRHMVSRLPESMVAASCSKNFGVYRDRVGAAFVIGEDDERTRIAEGNLGSLNRVNFSFPPDHGAKAISIVLHDDALRTAWQSELEEMRLNMLTLRQGLADALRRETNSDRFDYIAQHRGMFTQLGGTAEKVLALRENYGIYMVGTGRINIAGLPKDGLDDLAQAVAASGF